MPQVHDHPYRIGDADAIRTLIMKLEGASQDGGDEVREKLRKAVLRAKDMVGEVSGGDVSAAEDEEDIAFYHGLLTGYAVALQLA